MPIPPLPPALSLFQLLTSFLKTEVSNILKVHFSVYGIKNTIREVGRAVKLALLPNCIFQRCL